MLLLLKVFTLCPHFYCHRPCTVSMSPPAFVCDPPEHSTESLKSPFCPTKSLTKSRDTPSGQELEAQGLLKCFLNSSRQGEPAQSHNLWELCSC